MNITDLCKFDKRDNYGSLDIDAIAAIKIAYPKLNIETHSPGVHAGGRDAEIWTQIRNDWTLCIPSGKYESSRYYNSAYTNILAVESGRNKLNLPSCPLFLLRGRAFNSKYHSLSQSFYLFGRNEDGSYFAHKIRPKAGENMSLDEARAWVWNLKGDEKVSARQGDLALIPKKRASGHKEGYLEVELGNHHINADCVWRTKHRVFVMNPSLSHKEHHPVSLSGLYEARLGRAWGNSKAD